MTLPNTTRHNETQQSVTEHNDKTQHCDVFQNKSEGFNIMTFLKMTLGMYNNSYHCDAQYNDTV